MHITFWIFLCNYVLADSDSDSDVDASKYIDLLPEKEKEEFLQTVARRLVSSVKTKESRYGSGEELSDEQLDEQSDFVRQVLEDETKSFRKNGLDVNEDEESKDRALNSIQKKPHIDFTFRNSNQFRRSLINDTDLKIDQSNYKNTDNIDVAVKYDSNNQQTKIVSEEKASTEDILKGRKRPVRWIKDVRTVQSEEKGSDTNITNDASEQLKDDSQETNDTYVSNRESYHQDDAITGTATTIIESSYDQDTTIYEKQNDTSQASRKTKNNMNTSVDAESTETTNIDDKNKNLLNISQVETTVSSENDTNSNEKARIETSDYDTHVTVDTTEKAIHTTTSFKETTIILDTTDKSDNVVKMESVKNDSQFLETKLIARSNVEQHLSDDEMNNKPVVIKEIEDFKENVRPVLTTTEHPTNVEENTNVTVANSSSIKVSVAESNKTDGDILEDLVRAVRSGLLLNFDDENVAQLSPASKKKAKQYEVYEIIPGKNSFVKNNLKKTTEHKVGIEQPFYAPVYNYDPKHAYYNAHNRLGPNHYETLGNEYVSYEDEEHDRSIHSVSNESGSTLRKFKFPNKKYRHPEKGLPKRNSIRLPFLVQAAKKRDVYIHPNDYVDYYFARKHSTYEDKKKKEYDPDTDYKREAYIDIGNGTVKDYLRSVRQFLYNNEPINFKKTQPEKAVIDHTLGLNDGDDTKQLDAEDKADEEDSNVKALRSSDPQKIKFILLVNNKLIAHKAFDKNSDEYLYVENETDTQTRAEARLKKVLGQLNKTILRVINKINARQEVEDNDKSAVADEIKLAVGKIKSSSESEDVSTHFTELPTSEDSKIIENRQMKAFVNVLRDMIEMDDKALQQYDWLGTSVDILCATTKISAIGENLKNGNTIHPYDLNLLEYVKYLYKIALTSPELASENLREDIKKKKSVLPKNKKKSKEKKHFLTSGLKERVWLKRGRDIERERKELEDVLRFANDVENALSDLHNAIKHISFITNHDNQKWYKHLKDIYLKKPSRKKILTVILHLCTSRLIGLIEESVDAGLNKGYKKFVKENKSDVARIKKELLFVMKIMEEMRREDGILVKI